MTPEDRSNQIRAIEKSIERKKKELAEMQGLKIKFQHQQGLKEEIFRLTRTLAGLKNGKR